MPSYWTEVGRFVADFPDMRVGQIMWNCAQARGWRLEDLCRGPIDPYCDDNNIPAFLKYLFDNGYL